MVSAEKEEQRLSKENQSKYYSGMGMLLCMIKHSRPEVSNILHNLSKVLDTSTKTAYKEMLRMIKYVLGLALMV